MTKSEILVFFWLCTDFVELCRRRVSGSRGTMTQNESFLTYSLSVMSESKVYELIPFWPTKFFQISLTDPFALLAMHEIVSLVQNICIPSRCPQTQTQTHTQTLILTEYLGNDALASQQ